MEKGGVDTSLFKGVDKDIAKAESMITEMLAQINKGFSDTKEITAFGKKISSLDGVLTKIGTGLGQINIPENFKKGTKEIQTLTSKLETSKGKLEELKIKAIQFTNEQAKAHKISKEEATQIKEAVSNEKDLYEIIKKINIEKEKTSTSKINAAIESDEGKRAKDSINAAFRSNALDNKLQVNSIEGLNLDTQKLELYREALRKITLEGVNVQDAFTKFVESLNEADRQVVEQDNFIKTYTEDLRTLAHSGLEEAAKNGTISKEERTSLKTNITSGARGLAAAGASPTGNVIAPALQAYNTQLQETNHQTEELARRTEEFQASVQSTMSTASSGIQEATTHSHQLNESGQRNIETMREEAEAQQELNKTFNHLQNVVKQVLSLTSAWRGLRRIFTQTYQDITKLDKSFAQIAMVTNYSVQDMWDQYGRYSSMANKLGQSTESVIQASGLFYQQGLNTAEALSLTEDTMKLATLANLDFEESTSLMTAGLRAFHMEMDQGSHITDVYAELAAHAAADVQGIAYAMSKTASIANSAGMSFENTSAFLTQMIETTQEAPENIGTAMKTIIARFTELKENVAGTADSEFDDLDYNKVDTALKSVGVSIKDAQGQFRNLDEVFLELSEKWDTLDRNSQRYIATIAAGSRQQSRFIAMMENYDRTLELIETAQDSAGKSSEQFAKYQDTVEYKVNQLKNSWEALRVSFLDSSFFKNALDGLNNILNKINSFDGFDFTKFGVLFLTLGKTAVTNLIKGYQQAASGLINAIGKTMSQASSKITTSLGNKIPALNINVNTKKAQKEIDQLKLKISQLRLNNAEIQLDINEAQARLERLTVKIIETEEQIEEQKAYGINTTEAEEKLSQLKAKAEETKASILNNTTRINNNNASISENEGLIGQAQSRITSSEKAATQAKASALGTLFATTMTAAITSYTMRENPGEVFGDVFKSGIAAAIPGAISIATSLGIESTAALVASTAGIGLILIAITAAIAGLVAGIKALSKAAQENAERTAKQESQFYAASKELDRLTEAQEKLNEALDEANEKYDKAKNSYDYITDAKKRFEELNKVVGMSIEEQEDFLATQQEIAAELPELIDYYDAEGNAILTKLGGAWDAVLEKKKEYYTEAAQEQAFAELQANTGNLLIAKTDLAKEEGYKEDINDSFLQAFADIVDANKAGPDNPIRYDKEKSQWYHYDYEYGSTWYTDKNNKQGNIVTMQGALDALSESEKEKYGIILQEALQRSDPGGKLAKAVASYEQGTEVIKKIQELLSEGDESSEQAIRGELSKAITKTTNIDLSDKMTAVAEAEKDFEKSMSNLIESYALSSDTYAESSENVQRLMVDYQAKSLGTSYEEMYKNFKESNEFDKNWLDEKGNIKSEFIETANRAFSEYIEGSLDNLGISSTSIDKSLSKEFTENRRKFLDNFYKRVEEENLGIIEQVKEIQDSNVLSEDIKEIWQQQHQAQIDAYNNNIQAIAEILGETGKIDVNGIWQAQKGTFTATLQKLNSATQDLVYQHIQAVKQAEGEVSAQDYAKELANFKGKFKLNDNAFAQLLNLNMDNVNAASWETFKKDQIKAFKEAGIEISEDILQTFADIQEKYGEISITLTSEAGLKDMIAQLQELQKSWTDEQDTFVDVISSQLTEGEISLKQYNTLSKTLSDLNEDIKDYVSITDDGRILANAGALDALYRSQASNLDNQLEIQIEKIEGQIESLKQERDILEANYKTVSVQIDQLEQIQNQNSSLTQQLALVSDIGLAMGTLTQEEYQAFNLKTLYQGVDTSKIRADLNKTYHEQDKALQEQIAKKEELLDVTKKEKDEQIKIGKAIENSYNEDLKNKIEEYNKTIEEGQKKHLSAVEDVEKKYKELQKAQQNVIDKQKELNETLYGTENHKNKLDPLYNYTTKLERLQKAANDAREALDDIQPGDDVNALMDNYLKSSKKETVTRKAENQIMLTSIDNYKSNLDSRLGEEMSKLNAKYGSSIDVNMADFYYKDGDRWSVNFEALNAANIPDEISDYVEETIENINELEDNIEKNEEEIKKREKELRDIRKKSVEAQINLEKEVERVLKDKYQEEIDNLKDKYNSMEDADNDYLNALEDAVEKQRKLRDRQNQWEDLAQKEKRLSLMQRDTSGTNQVETQKLQKEIQSDREKLLDNSVDQIIESLKEMYDAQTESREAEVEYKQAVLDNANLIKEANAIIIGWESAEDAISFFYENVKGISEMSESQLEQETESWRDMYEAHEAYLATNSEHFKDTLTAYQEETIATEEEVQRVIYETGEALTSEAQRSLQEITAETDTAIESAKTALTDAIDNLTLKQKEYNDALIAEATALEDLKAAQEELYKARGEYEALAQAAAEREARIQAVQESFVEGANINSIGASSEEIKTSGVHGVVDDSGKVIVVTDSFKQAQDYIEHQVPPDKRGGLRAYKNGGLVDFTGPAWVDGSLNKPEAFLDADDTERIGRAANILASISDLLNLDIERDRTNYVNNDNSTTNGNTTVNVTVNVESISDDYGVDSAIERIKQDIADAANYAGSNVILRK